MTVLDPARALPFLTLLLFPAICLSQAADGSQPPLTVRGEVINSLTGQPIAGALVQIAGGHAALTDREGQFEMNDSTKGGAIGAFATKPGYFPEQSWGNGLGPPVQENHPITLKLNPEAIISGAVLDQNGQPIQGLHVQLKMLRIRDGLKHWQPMNSTLTNVEGEFRFAELQPGKYSLSSGFQVDGLPDAASSVAFAEVSYPPSTGNEEAALTLAWGDHIEANLTPPAQKLYAVTGHVENAPTQSIQFEAENSSGGLVSPVVRFNRLSGDFRLLLPSGSYRLTLHCYAAREALYATRQISINEAPLRNSSIALAPLATISVEAEYENLKPSSQETQPPQPSFLNVWLESADPGGSGKQFHAQPHPSSTPDNSLQSISNVEPGRYRLVAMPSPLWYVASATCGALDLTRETIDIAGSAAGCTIHAVLRNDSAALKWSVDAKSPANGPQTMHVYAVPLGNLSQPGIEMRTSSTAGTFEGLAPGRYLVMAFDHQQELPYREVDEIQRYLSLGQEVALTQNGTSDVQLNVVAGEP
jgi:hypothetical protein